MRVRVADGLSAAVGQHDGGLVDDFIEAELAEWGEIIDPLVQPLQRFLEAAARENLTAAQALERLPELLKDMDDGALVARLARTAFAARAGSEAGFGQVET